MRFFCIQDDYIFEKKNTPYIAYFKEVTNYGNKLLVNNNGELYCDTKGTQTCSVDIINTINKYLSLKCLSYEEAYKFFKYLLEIKNETNGYIEPISTLSKTGINIDNKMTQKQFNELMNKNHNNKYRSIQIFNDEKYNGYIVFLPTQFMPNK